MTDDHAIAVIRSVQVGPVTPIGPDGVPSGFRTAGVCDRIPVGRLGLQGDAQSELTIHCGPDNAVYVYPGAEHTWWCDALPGHAALLQACGFGENLTVSGLDADTTCIGDVSHIGSAWLQVTRFRPLRFELVLSFGDRRLPQAIVRSSRSGWYAWVTREGSLGRSDVFPIAAHRNPAWSIRRLAQSFPHRLESPNELSEL